MSRALLILANDTVRQRAIHWCQKAPVGTRVEYKAPKRTLPQNDLMWLRLTDISKALEWYGQHLSPDDWKDVFTASLRKARVVPGIEPGTYVPLGMRTSDLGVEEMTNLLELIAAFAAERGVDLSA